MQSSIALWPRFLGTLWVQMWRRASLPEHRDRDYARAYIDRKLGEGKARREARRAHKRHLANRVIPRMWRDEKHLM